MSEYARHEKQLAKPIISRLSHLDIELTERCNNNCIHCYINQAANDLSVKKREMTTDQVKEILQQAADLGCMLVRFTGGEPLIRQDFEDLYYYARKLGMKVMLFTNARLITPHLADLFSRIPPLMPIEVTVYGMHKESYEAVSRKPGSFAPFWRGINLLLECKISFIVKSTILPQTRVEMDEFEAWSKTLPGMPDSPGYSMFFDLRARRDDEEKNTQIKQLRVSPQEGIGILTRDLPKYNTDMGAFAKKFLQPKGEKLFTCGAGEDVCIDAYGRAQPCMGLRTPELTLDVLSANLPGSSQVNGDKGLAYAIEQFTHLGDLVATNPEYLRRCARCVLRGLCEQCPAKSWAETGTLDTPIEYLCEVAHIQARKSGWLGENVFGWEVANLDNRTG